MADVTNTTADAKTTTVKQENATTQSPTTGAVTKVESKTTTTVAPVDPATMKGKLPMSPRNKKIMNLTMYGIGAGVVSGIGYSFYKKKDFGGYLGYCLAGAVAFGIVTVIAAKFAIKADPKV